jgi:hypothetical protein
MYFRGEQWHHERQLASGVYFFFQRGLWCCDCDGGKSSVYNYKICLLALQVIGVGEEERTSGIVLIPILEIRTNI